MPIKQINYLHVDGKECCRCGVPFYWMDREPSEEDDPLTFDALAVPDSPPVVLRSYTNPLWWQAIPKKERKNFRKHSSKSYYIEHAVPDRYGIFCTKCSKREDRWIGIEGRPHHGARQ